MTRTEKERVDAFEALGFELYRTPSADFIAEDQCGLHNGVVYKTIDAALSWMALSLIQSVLSDALAGDLSAMVFDTQHHRMALGETLHGLILRLIDRGGR